MRRLIMLACATLALGGVALAQTAAPAPKPLHSRAPFAYLFATGA
jgi:hypothetical protein